MNANGLNRLSLNGEMWSNWVGFDSAHLLNEDLLWFHAIPRDHLKWRFMFQIGQVARLLALFYDLYSNDDTYPPGPW